MFTIKPVRIIFFLIILFFISACVSTGGSKDSRSALQKVRDNSTRFVLEKAGKADKPYLYPVYTALKNKQYDNAINQAEELKAVYPADEDIYYLQGVAYFEKRELKTAFSLFEYTLLINSDRGDAHNFSALMLYKLQKSSRALKHINLALSNNKTASQLLSLRQLTTNSNTFSIAAIKGRMYFLRAVIQKSLRNYAAAQADVLQAIHLSPYESSSHYTVKGDINFLKRDYHSAYRDYQKAISLNPKESDAWGGMGIIDIYLGHYNKAVTHLEKAIQINPKYNATLGNLGLAYWLLGNRDKAFESMGKAIRLKPVSGMYYHLAYFHHLNGNHAQARINFKKAKSIDADIIGTRTIYLDIPPKTSPTWQFYQQEYNTAKRYLPRNITANSGIRKSGIRITSLSLEPDPVLVNMPFDIKTRYQVNISNDSNKNIPVVYFYKIYKNNKNLISSKPVSLNAENGKIKSWIQHMNPVSKTGVYELRVFVKYNEFVDEKKMTLIIK